MRLTYERGDAMKMGFPGSWKAISKTRGTIQVTMFA